MKIAYLLGSLNRGGTETLMLDVFKYQSRPGYEFIGIYRKQGVYEKEFRATGHKIYRICPCSVFDIGYILKLRKILKQEKIDIVHAQQSIDAVFALFATMGSGIKVVQTFHGFDYNCVFKHKLLIKYSIVKTNANFFVSETQRLYYIDKYHLDSSKQIVVYNGVNFSKLDTKRPTISILQKKREEEYLFGSVGNFVAVRQQIVICRFLKLLKEQNVPFQFVFAGARCYPEEWRYDECVNYCRDNNMLENVHFLGSCHDVPNMLKQLDAFVYASHHDTFGIAVVEAIAAGLPVFVNDWNVMKEITSNGKWATLYKTGNEKDLLEQFMLFLSNIESRKTEVASRFKGIRDRFSIESHLNSLAATYNSL